MLREQLGGVQAQLQQAQHQLEESQSAERKQQDIVVQLQVSLQQEQHVLLTATQANAALTAQLAAVTAR